MADVLTRGGLSAQLAAELAETERIHADRESRIRHGVTATCRRCGGSIYEPEHDARMCRFIGALRPLQSGERPQP